MVSMKTTMNKLQALKRYAVALAALLFALAAVVAAIAPSPAFAVEAGDAAIIPVSVNGTTKAQITALNGAPEPEQSTVEIENSGEIRIPFGDGSVAESRYEVAQVQDDSTIVYDDTVWLVQIYVETNPNGGLNTAVITSKEGSEYKPGEITFENGTVEPDPDPDPETDPTPCIVDPPLKKVVVGDPEEAGSFTFAMKAVSNTAGYEVADMPMPDDSEDGVKRRIVEGPGEYEFGNFEITKAGTYVYDMVEEDTGEDGYTYDDVRYTITFEVVEQDGALIPSTLITDSDGNRVNTCEFTNIYTAPSPSSDPDPTPSVPKTPTPATPTTKSSTPSTTTSRTGSTPVTSDTLPPAAVVSIAALAAIAFAAVLVSARRRQSEGCQQSTQRRQ